MKLLIVTQRVDKKDPILGFFHRWVEEFAKKFDHVTVIGQMVGEYDFPKNVTVKSLGKENRSLRIIQVIRFWYLQWKLRKQYDRVLVHMTPIWIVLGALSWGLLRKKMYLWYEARGGGLAMRIAVKIVHKVFSASAYGMPIKSNKSRVMGHGIDMERFKPGVDRDENLIVTVGRITKAKQFNLIVDVLGDLPKNYFLELVGVTMTKSDVKLKKELLHKINQHGLRDRVSIAKLDQDALAQLLSRTQLFVHASHTGLDKAVLEAMASGCLVASCGKAFADVLPPECFAEKDEGLKSVAEDLLKLSEKEDQAMRTLLRSIAEKYFSLETLINNLTKELK